MDNVTENIHVEAAVNAYLDGIGNADIAQEKLQSAFYSSTNLHSLGDEGQLVFQPRDSLIEMAASGLMPEHSSEILTIEVTNDMAFAKVRLDLADRKFLITLPY